MRRVLVTGARGFVGRYTLAPLAAAGFEVHATTSGTSVPRSAGVTWHRADLLDHESVRTLMHSVRPSHLLHLAWVTAHGAFWHATENVAWGNASLNLLQTFREQGGERAVLTGSCAEYDWRDVEIPVAEQPATGFRSQTLYGTSKHAVRVLGQRYAAQSGLSLAWGRIFFIYGPGEPRPRLIPTVINNLLDRKPVRCTSGEQIRDLIFVEDGAQALVELVRSDADGEFNLGTGVGTRLKSVVQCIAERLDGADLVQFGARAIDEPASVVADCSRLRRFTGWQPRVDVHEGLERTIADWVAAPRGSRPAHTGHPPPHRGLRGLN